MFENPRRGRQARNFTTNVSKILDLKSSFEQIFFRKLSLGAPDFVVARTVQPFYLLSFELEHKYPRGGSKFLFSYWLMKDFKSIQHRCYSKQNTPSLSEFEINEVERSFGLLPQLTNSCQRA